MATGPTIGFGVAGTSQVYKMDLASYQAFSSLGNPIRSGCIIVDPTTTPQTVLGISDGAGGLAYLTVSQILSPVLWANIPSAVTVGAGATVQVTNVGVSPTWFVSDGTNWHPLNGMALLYNRAGSLASPLATLTAAIGIFTLPETLVIPASLISPRMRLCTEAQFQRDPVTATATINTLARIGNLNSSSDNSVLMAATVPATPGQHVPVGRVSVMWSTTTTATQHETRAGPNATQVSGNIVDITSNISTTVPLYVNFGVSGGNGTDPLNLINYKVWIEG